MTDFHNTFRTFGKGKKVLAENFCTYFLNYDPNEWIDQGGGGSFQFQDENDIEYTLMCISNQKYGILCSWGAWDKNINKSISEYYSVGNLSCINQIEDIGDEEFYPIGSFIQPKEAWLAVEDFFKIPSKKSNRVKWINVDEIAWPEDF